MFLLIILVTWLGEKERYLPLLLVLPILLFGIFLIRRNRAARTWRRARQVAAFYERRLACLEDRWAGGGEPGLRFLNESHPYALDLDLFGAGGLFERLCTASTRAGEDALATWLLVPTAVEEVRQRQQAIAELCPRLDLREEIALLGVELPAGSPIEAVVAWGKAEPVLLTRGLRLVAIILMTFTVGSAIAWIFGAGPGPFLATLLFGAVFTLVLRRAVRRVLEPLEQSGAVLLPFANLLQYLERQAWTSARLTQLGAQLREGNCTSSQRLKNLARLLSWTPLAFLLLWIVPVGLAAEAWRRTSGPALARWRATVGEIEALCALASYAYENPTDPFPEFVTDSPCFDAEELGHPLLARDRCVRNDVCLGGQQRLLIVSGSNMSGKSTLLRTVGVNAVLALAGAPVRARRLRVSLVSVGATLRIQDSLQAGRSRFYTEITRLRQLLDLAKGTTPLFFLLDELLQGTNSDERRLGAEGVLRTFLDHNAIGVVTTHDLALTQLADILTARATNVHFEDQLVNGTMTFDYRMRPGVAGSRNALALMRAVGFEV